MTKDTKDSGMPPVFFATKHIGEEWAGKWSTANAWGPMGHICYSEAHLNQRIAEAVAKERERLISIIDCWPTDTDEADIRDAIRNGEGKP